MPCLLKIKVLRARNLPSMDRKSSLTDAYVEIRFADAETLRTNICKKTLDPVWNEDFRMEVSDDSFLQNEPLELKVIDYDSITADDLIGSVFFDLNVLLMKVFEVKAEKNQFYNEKKKILDSDSNASKQDKKIPRASNNFDFLPRNSITNASAPGFDSLVSNEDLKLFQFNNSDPRLAQKKIENLSSDESVESFIDETEIVSVERENARSIGGWFPIFDCQTGIRGELQCQIKLEFFGDVNPFRGSSAGIRIFSMEQLPMSQFSGVKMCGFLSASITKSDPEYHWSDSFRTQRVSNESRQRLMYQLSGQLRRKMGRKAIECGANMILGYKHSFDFEEKNKTITARAVGTAVLMDLSYQSTQKRGIMNSSFNSKPSISDIDYNKVINPSTSASKNIKSIKNALRSDTDSIFSGSPNFQQKSHNIESIPENTKDKSNKNYDNKNDLSESNDGIYFNSSKRPVNNTSPNELASNNIINSNSITNDINIPEDYHSSADNASIEDSNKSYDSEQRANSIAPKFNKKSSSNLENHSIVNDKNSRLEFSKTVGEIEPNSKDILHDIVTLKTFPSSAIQRLGGAVMAHSVKVIEDDEEKTRQTWWDELRREIKSHAKSLSCTHILGYSESSSIWGDAIVLSVVGTAAVLDTKGLETGNKIGRYKLNSKFSNAYLNDLFSSKKVRDLYRRKKKGFGTEDESDYVYLKNPSKRKNLSIDVNSKSQKASNKNDPSYLNINSRTRNLSDSSLVIKKSKYLKNKSKNARPTTLGNFSKLQTRALKKLKPLGCRMCHSPDDRQNLPYPMRFFRCGYCQKSAVPEIILSTIELPTELNIIEGEATIVEAHICKSRTRPSTAGISSFGEKSSKLISTSLGKLGINRNKTENNGVVSVGGTDEAYAAFVSDALPFIQYDLHRQLLYKLSVYGMNAIFGLKYHLSLGEDMIIATATGTAIYVTALPTPGPLIISRNIGVMDEEDRGFLRIQNRITNLSVQNRERLDNKFNKKKLSLLELKNSNMRRYSTKKKRKYRRRSKENISNLGNFKNADSKALQSSVNQNSDSENRIKLKRGHSSTICPNCGSNVSNYKCESCEHELKSKNKSIQASVAVQIDDDADEDLMAALFDHPLNQSFSIVNTDGKLFYKPKEKFKNVHIKRKRLRNTLKKKRVKNYRAARHNSSTSEIFSHVGKLSRYDNSSNKKTAIIHSDNEDLEIDYKPKLKEENKSSLVDQANLKIIDVGNSISSYSSSSSTSSSSSSSSSSCSDSDSDSESSSISSDSSSSSSSSSKSEISSSKKLKNRSKDLINSKATDEPDSLLFDPSFHQSLIVAKRVYLDPQSKHPNRLLANIFNQTYQEMCSNLFYFSRCLISSVGYTINIVEDSENEVQLLLTATAVGVCRFPSHLMIPAQLRGSEEVLNNSVDAINTEPNRIHSISSKRSDLSNKPKHNNYPEYSPFNILGGKVNSDSDLEDSTEFSKPKLAYEKGKKKLESKLNSILNKISLEETKPETELVSSDDNEAVKVDLLAKNSSFFDESELETRIQVPLGLEIPPLLSPSTRSIFSESINKSEQNSINQSLFSSFKNRPAYLSTDSVELTSLNHLPGHKIVSIMGRLSMHFIKESSIEAYSKGPVGMPAYILSFINDMNSSIKSQIEALHGNALICMSIDHQKFINSDKSSAYGMLSISGDVVFTERIE
ncbi:C2 domain-containing protein 5 [Smittium culicis]|uniref:C2 domain-containing protein 5 n=1 Tax=Smittium culicis TaxID=133412 RepID=A0A1R1Y0Y9_9FUNG|nr:C2 domain-containing protein 5 [Smittium culicis]